MSSATIEPLANTVSPVVCAQMPAPLPEPRIWLRAIVACVSVVKFELEPVDAMPAPLPIPVTRLNATVVLPSDRSAAPFDGAIDDPAALARGVVVVDQTRMQRQQPVVGDRRRSPQRHP